MFYQFLLLFSSSYDKMTMYIPYLEWNEHHRHHRREPACEKRILTICVRLFLQKGFKKTTLAENIEKATTIYLKTEEIP